MRDAIVAALLTVFVLGAHARHLGTIGPLYPITEPSLLDQIMRRLKAAEDSGELLRHREEAVRRFERAVESPAPVVGLATAAAPRTSYFDPTFVLQDNVVDPKGQILFPAGISKNPLEVVRLPQPLLFFDGRDPRQVAKAREVLAQHSGKVKPILVGGSYMALMRQWGSQVYYDQYGTLVRRLGIRAVPSFVTQEGMRLRIDEVPVR